MTTELTAILSSEEAAERAACEAIIREGKATFVRVGAALARMRDQNLYRSTHATFPAYCLEVWDFTDERARLLMRSAEVVARLSETPTMVGVLPTGERQVRPLTQLKEPEMQREAWSEAVEEAGGKQPTAKQVQAVVERRKQTGISREALPVTVTLGRDLGRAAHLIVEFYTATEIAVLLTLIQSKGDPKS